MFAHKNFHKHLLDKKMRADFLVGKNIYLTYDIF